MTPELDARSFADLAESLQARPSPVETAEEVVAYAQQQLDADLAGLTLLAAKGELRTLAPTDPVVETVDALQYELDEGIWRDSSWGGDILQSADLGTDPRWPRWGPKVAALGITSVLAAELATDDRRIGSINLYWRQRRDFRHDDAAYASIFARHAAVALNASLTEANLHVALDTRKLIGQAQGILMERHQIDADRAFQVLRRYSQDHNVRLRLVAEQLVATRRLPGEGRDGRRLNSRHGAL